MSKNSPEDKRKRTILNDISMLGMLAENNNTSPEDTAPDSKAEAIRRKQEAKNKSVVIPINIDGESVDLHIKKGSKLSIADEYKRNSDNHEFYDVEDIDFKNNWVKLGIYSAGNRIDEEILNINAFSEGKGGEDRGDSLEAFVDGSIIDLEDSYRRYVKKEEIVVKKDVEIDSKSGFIDEGSTDSNPKSKSNRQAKKTILQKGSSPRTESSSSSEQYPDEGTVIERGDKNYEIVSYDFKNETVKIRVTKDGREDKWNTISVNFDTLQELIDGKDIEKESGSKGKNQRENRGSFSGTLLEIEIDGKVGKYRIANIQTKLSEGIVIRDHEHNDERVLVTYATLKKNYGDDYSKILSAFIRKLIAADSRFVIPRPGEDIDWSKEKDTERYSLAANEKESADPELYLKRLHSEVMLENVKRHPNFKRVIGWENRVGKKGSQKLYKLVAIDGKNLGFEVSYESIPEAKSEVSITQDEFVDILNANDKERESHFANLDRKKRISELNKSIADKINSKIISATVNKEQETESTPLQKEYDESLFKFPFENPNELEGQNLEDHIFHANNYFKLLKNEEKRKQFGVYLTLLQERKSSLEKTKSNNKKQSPQKAFQPSAKADIEADLARLANSLDTTTDEDEKAIIRKNMDDLFAELKKQEGETKEARLKKSFEILENKKLDFAEKAKAIMDLGFDSLVLHGNPMYDETRVQYFLDNEGSYPSKTDKGTILTTERTDTPAVKTGLDMDERLLLKFFNNSKFAKGFGGSIHNNTEIVPKGSSTLSTEAGVYVHFDTGGKQGFRIEKKDDQIHIFFDNHGEDKGKVLSAAESYHKWARKVGALEKASPEIEELNAKLLDYVGKVDNAIAPQTVEFMHEVYPRTLIGLQKNLRLKDVINLIKKGYGPYDVISNKDLSEQIELLNPQLVNKKDNEGNYVLDASGKKVVELKTHESLRSLAKSLEIKIDKTSRNLDNNYLSQLRTGIKGSNKELGRLVYHDSTTNYTDPFMIARTIGFDTYIRHDKVSDGLYINSTLDLTKLKRILEKKDIAERIQLVRNNMIFIRLKKGVDDEAVYRALDIKREKNKYIGMDIEKIKEEKKAKEARIKEIKDQLNQIKKERDIINKK